MGSAIVTSHVEMSDPEAASNDSFGSAVALSGDTALIGAFNKTVGGKSKAGAAYVFVRSGTGWAQQAELSDPNAASNDSFGYAVALSGDTALIGAFNKTVGGKSKAGAAYVFVRSGTGWAQQAELSDPNAAAGDRFGFSVALSGDTAVIGAVGRKGAAGAAYVFVRSGTGWAQQTELRASDAAADNEFGSSVAVSGDTALVGAFGKSVSGQAVAGAAYVFVGSGTGWAQQAELSDPDPASGECFGSSVALSGDTALIGAFGKTVGGRVDSGAAYVFVRSATSWTRQAQLWASDALLDDEFGSAVTLSGDRALIGTYRKTIGGQIGAGAAYMFVRTGTGWTQQAELRAADTATHDYFGSSVALSADTALVGAWGKTVNGQSYAGAAYVEALPGQ